MYLLRDEYVFDLEKPVVVEVPQAGHATYVFSKPPDVGHWIWLYAKTTRQDVRSTVTTSLNRSIFSVESSTAEPNPNGCANSACALAKHPTHLSKKRLLNRSYATERFSPDPTTTSTMGVSRQPARSTRLQYSSLVFTWTKGSRQVVTMLMELRDQCNSQADRIPGVH